MSRTLIDIKDITVRRAGMPVIEKISFSVSTGQIVTLIGPNGSGKSTTAKTILGLIKPDAGSLNRAPGLKIGYVPQKLTLEKSLPMTVRRFMNLTGRHVASDIIWACEKTRSDHLLGRDLQDLSGGEFQRVQIARALLSKPDLLVLDEPVQGVDFNGEIEVYDLIRTLADTLQCGILLISHDLHIVMAKTDTVICLNGHICCSGSPDIVAQSAEYGALFGGRAKETLAIYHHHHDHTHAETGEIIR